MEWSRQERIFKLNLNVLCLIWQVLGIMRNNVDKVLERDAKLQDLDDRAGNLRCG